MFQRLRKRLLLREMSGEDKALLCLKNLTTVAFFRKYDSASLPPISPPSDEDNQVLSIDVKSVVQFVREQLRRWRSASVFFVHTSDRATIPSLPFFLSFQHGTLVSLLALIARLYVYKKLPPRPLPSRFGCDIRTLHCFIALASPSSQSQFGPLCSEDIYLLMF